MNHEEIRMNHFARLNNYRHSAEYAEYVQGTSEERPPGELPSLLGNRWEIDRQIYHEFLEMLPPLDWQGDSFFMREFTFGNITAKYTREGDRYYCEFAQFQARRVPEHKPVDTPWGVAQFSKDYAPGIVFYSTASHGGFHLSEDRVAEMPKLLRDFVPFGGEQRGPGRWFEEDCDWAVVALAFPQFFPADAVPSALATLKHYKPALFSELVKDIDLPTGKWQQKLSEEERARAKQVAGLG